MDNSPLQLYKKAYDLHYRRKKLRDASYIYKELINNFPGSDVANYASIQMSKIQSHYINRNMPNNYNTNLTPRQAGILTILIINIILTLGAIFWLAMHIQSARNQNMTVMKLSQVMGKMYADKDIEAINILKELKFVTHNSIVPYEMTADIYLKKNDFAKARNEYETFQSRFPENLLSSVKIDKINREEKAYLERIKKTELIEKPIQEPQIEKKTKKNEKPRTVNRKKEVDREYTPKIIDDEDISYF